jgi:hypothetical protein
MLITFMQFKLIKFIQFMLITEKNAKKLVIFYENIQFKVINFIQFKLII